MSCKFPVESRSHKACALCSDKDLCSDSTVKNDDMTLLSASEAHKNTVNNIKNCSTKELAEISKRIREAITDGKFSISGDGCLQYETTQRLEELNYKVQTGIQYNEQYWSISWKYINQNFIYKIWMITYVRRRND